MKSASPEKCLEALRAMSAIADTELSRTLEGRATGPTARMYNMLRYFMGYVDENFTPSAEGSGKRFRPSLCLFIAGAYGAREKALEAAVAIELFHNFTLIHDDVEDRDEYRRNKPTVWKLWGVNHAINSGDVQSLIATEWIARAARHPDVGARLAELLVDAFIKVGEGQYLDFELASAPIGGGTITEESYVEMTHRKSGVLVAVAAESAGAAAGKSDAECALLRDYGNYLGISYQMADDFRSVWSTQVETGKDTHSDIREHKRTLPFLAGYKEVSGKSKERLASLYSLERQLDDSEIQEVLAILDSTSARKEVLAAIREYAERSKTAAAELSIDENSRAILCGIVDMLIPEGMVEYSGEEPKLGK